jgi:outer membrane protein OmpA-like peptidoglycan-associated protein
VGWLHVFQPDDSLRPADANVLSLGLHALFDTARPAVVAEPPPAPLVNADTDGDGLPNATDGCPLDAEDRDGFEDEDGCPDPDNDADRVLDAFDRCPLEAEDHDGFEDEDGCPDADNDADHIPDAEDRCPLDAEDQDDFEDEDGCPDPDNDGDGFEDGSDDCPLEPEVVNGYADEDGCPDEDQVRVVGDRIVLDERIHFMTNSAYIRHKSHDLVLRLARLLNQHPEYVHVEVQGHADARGDERFNQRLSERRATAVMDFLIGRGGVDAERLHATGYGTSQPLVDAADPAALYMNRRVELRVTRRPRASEKAP